MAFNNGANGRTTSARSKTSSAADMSFDDNWGEGEKPRRDWIKMALTLGLGTLSWIATYIGMLELIEANMGELPFTQRIVIAFAVAMLMLMIIWLLDQLFSQHNFITKLAYVGGYLFLTMISVGFGFGFYWKVLESRSESTRSAESAITQVQTSLHAANTRMGQLTATLDNLAALSSQKAIEERESGTSCPNSRPGDGPRRKLRDADAATFGFSSRFVKGRAGSVGTNMKALNADMEKVVKSARSTVDATTGTRNDFMRALNRKLDLTVTGFNAFRTDPQLKQIRADLSERSQRTSFPDSRGGTFSCPDPQLQAALRGVVRAIDQLPVLEKPKIAAVEGSEAVIEAFRRLTTTFAGALVFKLPPTPEELRELQQKAVRSVESASNAPPPVDMELAGLSKRDYVPLSIAIFVDLCLLLVSMGRGGNRLQNLLPRMRQAEKGPMIQILSRFHDIHKDEATREKFEIFRHVVFDWAGEYYVAVPLDAPYSANIRSDGGRHSNVNAQVDELQQEAHLLSNLFASFEKEKIFSRVLMPLFTTNAIRKKLHRQGSKFAGSSAFRVYKFRDGAWSEIILGAVMGAARRVEAERRKRGIEDELFVTEGEPSLDRDNDATDRHIRTPEEALAAMRNVADEIDHVHHADEASQTAFGRYANHATAELNSQPSRPANVAQGHAGQHRGPAPLDAAPANNNTAPQGRPAPAARHTYESDTLAARLAANVAEQARPSGADAENVIHLPGARPRPAGAATQSHPTADLPSVTLPETRVTAPVVTDAAPLLASAAPRPGDERINVELRERSVTYSIPAEDARLPGTLASNLATVAMPGSATAAISTPALPAAIESEKIVEAEAVIDDAVHAPAALSYDEPTEYVANPDVVITVDEDADEIILEPASFMQNSIKDAREIDFADAPEFAEAEVEISIDEISRRFAPKK